MNKKIFTKKNIIIFFIVLIALGVFGNLTSKNYNEKAEMYWLHNSEHDLSWFYSEPITEVLGAKIFFTGSPFEFLYNGRNDNLYVSLMFSVLDYKGAEDILIKLEQNENFYEFVIKDLTSYKKRELAYFLSHLDREKDLVLYDISGSYNISSKELKALQHTVWVYYEKAEKLYSTS